MNVIVKFLRIITFGMIEYILRIYRNKRTKRNVRKILKDSKEVKLEIGAGNKKDENGWTTLDKNNACDLDWDLRNGIPFPDCSIDIIYSSHLFEHLPYQFIISLLSECKRVLKRKGLLLICVPNAAFFLNAYFKKDNKFFDRIPSFYNPAVNNTTVIDIVNYIAYMDGEHHYMFDEENLLYILKSSGFRNVKLRDFNPELDSIIRHHESIYAECYR